MNQHQYRPGEVIYRVGDRSSTICRLANGRAELIAHQNGAETAIAVLEPGDMVGEVEVLAGRPRDATLRALTAVEIEHLKPSDFLQWVGDNRGNALDLIQRLSDELQSDQEAPLELDQPLDEAPEAPLPSSEPPAIFEAPRTPERPGVGHQYLMLYAGGKRLNTTIPDSGMEITALPFTVGRMSERREPRLVLVPDLLIEEQSPFKLSRAHFLIARESSGIVVRDLGSTHGTLVNGKKLGERKPDDSARLKPGENTIQAGGPKSPFIFRLVLQGPQG